MKTVMIQTRKGWQLSGLLFEPDGPVRDVYVLSGATGVPRDFYKGFARWCSKELGVACLIYDYRDFGTSKVNGPKQSKVLLSDWGIYDQQAAVQFAIDHFPDHKITLVGHSLGGMFLQYQSDCFGDKIKQAFTVASGSGFWLQHPLYYIPVAATFWLLMGPVATKLLGYMPGRALGLGSDLPASVYWQWRGWCLSRRFYSVDRPEVIENSTDTVGFPVKMFALADDVMIPLKAVRFLQRFYQGAEIAVREISPSEAGLKSLGHIHVFSGRNKKVWPLIFGDTAQQKKQ
jgi:predicted alpha/beta hydrolase